MINLITNRFKKKHTFESYIKLPYHQWIDHNFFIKKVFRIFFNELSSDLVNKIINHKKVAFIKISDPLSCLVTPPSRTKSILILPECYKYLCSFNFSYGLAIIAHELGHIINDHNKSKLSSLEKQKEADLFAANLGFGLELIEILMDYKKYDEINPRIDHLKKYLKG